MLAPARGMQHGNRSVPFWRAHGVMANVLELKIAASGTNFVAVLAWDRRLELSRETRNAGLALAVRAAWSRLAVHIDFAYGHA